MNVILFFDGECGFCNRSVRLVNRLDRSGVVDFAPLQGKLAEELGLRKFAAEEGGTVVLLRERDGEKFYKGDALSSWGKLSGSRGKRWRLVSR